MGVSTMTEYVVPGKPVAAYIADVKAAGLTDAAKVFQEIHEWLLQSVQSTNATTLAAKDAVGRTR